ncbi:MAG TPA: class I SAM-dependent methyltransferase [Vicinamibacterales bacterium]|nr:class I SAM-dependent methyltransferase [Vicinamibacterales bacterium]
MSNPAEGYERFMVPPEALPFADRSFDLVLCQFAMMFFADRRAAAAEMRRVLTG